jgi:DNA-binding NarL/FixJ family response regulator
MDKHSGKIKLKVLIVDDHLMTLDGIERCFNEGTDFTIIAKALTAESAILAAKGLQPDLILLDLHLPGDNSVRDTLAQLKEITRSIVILSGDDRPSLVKRALKYGAAAYLLKSDSYEKICETLMRVHQGEGMIVSDRLKQGTAVRFTQAEEEILELMAKGMSANDIAETRVTSVHTIRKQYTQLQKKLNLNSREALIAWAVNNGYGVKK